MTPPEPTFAVKVDLANPGQFFACCGLLELSHRLSPTDGIEAWFAGSAFCMVFARNGGNALGQVIDELRNTEVTTDRSRGDRATHPVHLPAFNLTLDWWIDNHGDKTPLKLWAGQQTSLRIVNDLRKALLEDSEVRTEELFDAGRPLTGRFGVDPRAAWNALDVGFSPNEQGMEVLTFPAVELLAAVGIQGFPPLQEENARFRYATWAVPLPACVARPASAGLLPAGDVRTYRFRITSRGSYKGFDYATLSRGESKS